MLPNHSHVFWIAKQYNADEDPVPREENGVTWYTVGHNASHVFYLGVDAQDRLYRKSIGEGMTDGDIEIRVSGPLTWNEVGYIGHF